MDNLFKSRSMEGLDFNNIFIGLSLPVLVTLPLSEGQEVRPNLYSKIKDKNENLKYLYAHLRAKTFILKVSKSYLLIFFHVL